MPGLQPLRQGNNRTRYPPTQTQAETDKFLSELGWQAINIRADLCAAIAEEKRNDPNFVYARDKVHPGERGHDFIAASFVRQIGPLWNLPGKPTFADGKALFILETHAGIIKHALLGKPDDGLAPPEKEKPARKKKDGRKTKQLPTARPRPRGR